MFKWCAVGMLSAMLIGCGGGGGGSDSGTNSSGYFGITAAKGGSSYTVCIDNAAFVDPNSEQGKAISAKLYYYYSLTGNSVSLSGTGQGCREKYPFADVTISTAYYNDIVSKATAPLSGSSPTVETPTTNGGTTTTGGSTSSSTTYVTVGGNANGSVIRDKSNRAFAINASSRVVTYLGAGTANGVSPVALSGLTVDTQGKVLDSGSSVGYIGSTSGSDGSKISVFYCNDGTYMDIAISTGWSISCGTGTSATGGGGGTNVSGGTTGNGTEAPTALTFINWSNSANGVVVLDSTGERFAFNQQTRCMYSYNTQKETSNYCLSGTNTGSLAGISFRVLLVSANGGGCIAALVDSSGYMIDIYTNASGVQVAQSSSIRANTTGCS